MKVVHVGLIIASQPASQPAKHNHFDEPGENLQPISTRPPRSLPIPSPSSFLFFRKASSQGHRKTEQRILLFQNLYQNESCFSSSPKTISKRKKKEAQNMTK
jgi:hypothetical protein